MQSGHNEAETIFQTLKVLPPDVFEETMKQLVVGLAKWHNEVGEKTPKPEEDA